MEKSKFSDPPNLAVITDWGVVRRGDWIAYVSHDLDDGGWQFLGSVHDPDDHAVASLQNMVDIDPSVLALVDLPLGWYAVRDSSASAWRRSKSP